MYNLEGKVALVTGASSGIGRASALAFSKEGVKVIVTDVAVDGGEKTVEMIKGAGGEAVFVRADVSRATEVEALINKTVKTYGRLDFAHNNAGVEGVTAPTAECTEENWDYVMKINLKGVWLCMKYEIPQMVKQGGGAIVNTASIGGLVGIYSRPAYAASKHGVAGLTKAAAMDYGKANVRVNAVAPGVIRTALAERLIAEDPQWLEVRVARHPIGRVGTTQEIAGVVLWLCSDAASFVTGVVMAVDGGYTAQ